MRKKITSSLLLAIILVGSVAICQESLPYSDDPEIIKIIENLGDNESIFLPKAKHKLNGEDIVAKGRLGRPYARDYTNKMVYAPERQTSLYCGGNHGMGRTNDVWEYHLGSNTWHCLFEPDGGDHAVHKSILMFLPQKLTRNPDYELDEKEKEEFVKAKKWWEENVVFKDGHYLTKRGGTLLHGHTWDTLVYEESIQKLIQGNGAHSAQSPWLIHKFTGMPLEEAKEKLGKNPDGVPYRTMWIFDPKEKKWTHYASHDPLAELRGMGATLCYLPDLKKTFYYVAAQNVSPNAFSMRLYDGVADKWEELKSNEGKNISELVLKMKVAPNSEAQFAYSVKHKKVVAVLKANTYCYDVEKNEWSLLNSNNPLSAHDAKTTFAYDSVNDVFFLAGYKTQKLGCFDLKTNEWKELEPKGGLTKQPQFNEGKGYFDPKYNVLVLQSANSDTMWLYRYARAN